MRDENKELLSGATILFSKDASSPILAYGITDSAGNFKVHIDTPSDSLFLKISFLGYSTREQNISNRSQMLQIQLAPSSESLKEVEVASDIIEQRGDTLSFSVSAFKDQKDRVIGDVIKKMPGIQIMPNGQIQYQGKPINKYYIEGLDLLEGRYNLANNNLSAKDVSKVQILENHQPKKVLDSLEFSDQAALNIKLKKNVSLSGTASLGSGFSPLLWKANITPMVFTKEHQAILSYQANNTGTDVSSEIRDYSFNMFNANELNIDKKDWLSIRQLADPPFSQERWLDNNAHLASMNYLARLKKDVDLKVNVSYLNDSQQQQGNTKTQFFTPTDTINLLENTNNELFINSLQSKLIFERNVPKDYLKNELAFNSFWHSQQGFIATRSEQILQELSNPFTGIQNKLHLLKPLGKQLITFKSNLGYIESNQHLSVLPGQFEDLLNNGNEYSEIGQFVSTTNFFADNSAGFTKGFKEFNISPEVGISYQNQQLDSELMIQNEDTENRLNAPFLNNLDFSNTRLFATSSFIYKNDNWNIRLNTPFNYRIFDIADATLNESQELGKLTFEPRLFVKHKISAFWESSISANLNNDFGDLDQLYYGFILRNYRSIQRYNSPIPQQLRQSYSCQLAYRDALKSIFANVRYSFSNTRNNLLYSNEIGENGSTLFESIAQENYSNSHNWNAEGSKYFNSLKTTLNASANFLLTNREQLLNGNLADIENRSIGAGIGVESEITDWLSTSYAGEIQFLQTEFGNRNFQEIVTQQHELGLFFYLNASQYINLDSEYYFNNISETNQHNYFLNLSYQYTFKNPKIDLNISWNNILNTDEFVNVYNNEFSYVESRYQLRPSQLLLSVKFSF